VTVDVDNRVLVADTTARATFSRVSAPATTPDGRYVVWVGVRSSTLPSPELTALDLVNRLESRVLGLSVNSAVFIDRARVRAFLGAPNSDLLIVEPMASSRVPLGCQATVTGVRDLTTMSGDRTRAFVLCPPVPEGTTLALDVASGTRVATIADSAWEQAANTDGSELYTLPFPGSSPTRRVTRIDVSSGALLAEADVGTLDEAIGIRYEGRSSRVFVFDRRRLLALDAHTLAEVGRLDAPIGSASMRLAFDPDLPHLYIAWSGGPRHVIQQVDIGTMSVLAQGELLYPFTSAGLVIGPRVTPPSGLTSHINGRQVRLEWTPTQEQVLRTGFLVEAGSDSGLANLAQFRLGPDVWTFTVENVPPGQYYVRVRTMNGTGPSARGPEIVVLVP
jgi:hypothetical protein